MVKTHQPAFVNTIWPDIEECMLVRICVCMLMRFPKGAQVSYAHRTKTLRNGIHIPEGLHFKGMLNFEFWSDVSADWVRGISIKGTAAGFDMGSGLVAGSNATLKVDIPPWPQTHTSTVSGVMSVVGINKHVDIVVDETNMHFDMTGMFLGLFQSHFEVSVNQFIVNRPSSKRELRARFIL